MWLQKKISIFKKSLLNKKKREDFINPREERRENSKTSIRDLFDGSLLSNKNVVNQLPFIVYLTCLGLIYISNHYRYEKEFRNMVRLKNEVSEYRFQSIDIAAELIQMNRQSEVIKRVNEAGLTLEELKGPVVKIMVDKP